MKLMVPAVDSVTAALPDVGFGPAHPSVAVPPLAAQLVEFVEDQLRVISCPSETALGAALRVTAGTKY
jgi:hypothetical protein